MRARGLLVAAFWVLVTVISYIGLQSAHADTNSWLEGVDGKWEDGAKWSLPTVPSVADSQTSLTATGFAGAVYTVTVDATTVLSNTINGCMTISNLNLSRFPFPFVAPLLAVSNSGTATPLQILNNLTVFEAGKVYATNSLIQLGNALAPASTISGTIQLDSGGTIHCDTPALNVSNSVSSPAHVFITGGQLVQTNSAGNLFVNGGLIAVTNGLLLAKSLFLGQSGNAGTLIVAGGTVVTLSNLFIGTSGATGSVWVTGGQLVATNVTSNIFVGNSGPGLLTISNSTVQVNNAVAAVNANSTGIISLAGGTLNTTTLLINTNGVLRGCGTVTGSVTINPGGTNITDCGTLTFTGIVTNNGTMIATETAVLQFNGLMVNNGLIDVSSGGGVQFSGGVVNNGTILTPSPTNSWLSSSVSGKWEDASKWSLGAPSLSDSAEVVTNGDCQSGPPGCGADFTITLDGVSSFDSSRMTISNLVLGADGYPAGNRLNLQNAGSFTPLRILDSFHIGLDGYLTITNSTLIVDGLSSNDQFSIHRQFKLDSGLVVATNASIIIASTIPDQFLFAVNGGTVLARDIIVGANIPPALVGTVGQMNLNGGKVDVIGGASYPFGGSFIVGYTNANSSYGTNTVVLNGGELDCTNNAPAIIGGSGTGQMIVSNGVAVFRQLFIGFGNTGSLAIFGGSFSIWSNLMVGNCSASVTGNVTISGGTLAVTNATHTAVLEVRDGLLTVGSGATLLADVLVMTNSCATTLSTAAGATIVVSTFIGNLDPNGDADGDGLPNGWEQKYGLNPLNSTGTNGASGDPDGDHINNQTEYVIGTDPRNASDPFRITDIHREGSDIRVTWQFYAGYPPETYKLDSSDNLGFTSNTFVIGGPVVINFLNGIISTNQLDVGGATNLPARYYRVRWENPP